MKPTLRPVEKIILTLVVLASIGISLGLIFQILS